MHSVAHHLAAWLVYNHLLQQVSQQYLMALGLLTDSCVCNELRSLNTPQIASIILYKYTVYMESLHGKFRDDVGC